MNSSSSPDLWPALPLAEWNDTYATLLLWTQIVGKIRLTQRRGSITRGTAPIYVTREDCRLADSHGDASSKSNSTSSTTC